MEERELVLPGYVAIVERLPGHIRQWLESREQLPDLKFYDHGKTLVGAYLEPLTYGLLARTPDAVALLEYLAGREPEVTMFMVRIVLDALGFLQGAELLSPQEIRTRMAACGVPVAMYDRHNPKPPN